MKLKALMVASAVAMTIGGAASASMVYNIIPGSLPSNNDFESNYESAFGVGDVGFGLVKFAENTVDGAVYNFDAIYAESGFDNGFRFSIDGTTIVALNEPVPASSPSPALDARIYTDDDMLFVVNAGSGTDAGLGDVGFGIFYDLGNVGETSDYVFLAFSDRAGEVDGDYDDLVVRTTGDVNVIPLPAAGWMLLAGLGGLAAMRRRQKA